MNEYYVYGHYVPGEDTPFYIGKGRGRRYKKTDGRNKWWRHIVNKHGYEVKFLHEGLTEEDALNKEIELIKYYGRRDIGTGILVNLTDGGDGVINHIQTEEHKEKNRIAHLGTNNSFYGKTHADDVRKKIIEANTGINNPNYGRPRSEETRKKISDAMRGKIKTKEHIAKIRETKMKKNSNK